jgi:hypothetical protein
MGLKMKTIITIRIHPIIFLRQADMGNSSPSKVQRFKLQGSRVQRFKGSGTY